MWKVLVRPRVVVVTLLTIHAGLLLHSLRQNFVVVDESAHLAAGISHWQTGTYSMYRVNPPLPRMLAVLPVLLASPNTDGIYPIETPGIRAEFRSERPFVADNAERYFDLVCLARLAGVGWSLLGGWLIYCWGRELYGAAAGCLALALWCFEPNVLAFAQVVLPDLPATVAALAAAYAYWRYLRSPTWGRAWFAGVLLGIAELTKFTLLVFYVVWPLLWLIHRLGPRNPALSLWKQACQLLLILGLSVLVINLGYEFRESGRRLEEIPFVSRTLSGMSGDKSFLDAANRFRDTWFGRTPVPVPVDYLRGIDVQRSNLEYLGERTGSYLAGEWREVGWWYYYLYAMAVKVPLGIWCLVLWALALSLSRRPASAHWTDELSVWLPALAVLVLVSSQTGFNHHMRYVLPLFPFALVSAGKLAYFLRWDRRMAAVIVLALVVWSAASSLRLHPHYLSYFNELGGGPNEGHRHLVDSNIDYGQDLLFLKDWLAAHPEARPLQLAYFGGVDPSIVGIQFTLPSASPQPGHFAISVSYLRGSTLVSAPNGRGGKVGISRDGYSYFQHFTPIAKAGYSIFIYHITLEEANRVRRELGLPLLGDRLGDRPDAGGDRP